MSQQIKDKLRKLLAHAESAATYNAGEAKLYQDTAKALMKKHRISKKSLEAKQEQARETPIVGTWNCSCGFVIELSINAGKNNVWLVNMACAGHVGPGHELKRIK